MAQNLSLDAARNMVESIQVQKGKSGDWVKRTDIAIAILLASISSSAEEKRADPQTFLEVGVWRGGWSVSILMSLSSAVVTGLDPYPGFGQVRQELIEVIHHLQLSHRFQIVNSFDQLEPMNKFDFVHVDGEHSERAVKRDLESAAARLSPQGVIAVDDYRNFWFPGVSSALHAFVLGTDFRVFCVTDSKAYLTSLRHADRYRNELFRLLKHIHANTCWLEHGDWLENARPYRQSTAIHGCDVLLVTDELEHHGAHVRGLQKAIRQGLKSLKGQFRPL